MPRGQYDRSKAKPRKPAKKAAVKKAAAFKSVDVSVAVPRVAERPKLLIELELDSDRVSLEHIATLQRELEDHGRIASLRITNLPDSIKLV